MAHQFHTFGDDVTLAKTAAGDWLVKLAKRDKSRAYAVALSGGRIAKNFFQEIAAQAKANGGDVKELFRDVHFFWADERCVPPDDAESNYAIAKKLLFEPLAIAEGQVHRLRGEGPEAVALDEAIKAICKVCGTEQGQAVLDMVFLGMGEDGHVASLFPGESESVIADAAIYRAVTAVKPPPRRITLGYKAIFVAKEVWVIAAGAGKEAALRESVRDSGKTPLARVLKARGKTDIYTDIKIDGK